MTILCLISKSSVTGNLMAFSQKIFRRGIGDPGADKGSPEGGGGAGPQREVKDESDNAESEALINDSFRLFSNCQDAFQSERAPLPKLYSNTQ